MGLAKHAPLLVCLALVVTAVIGGVSGCNQSGKASVSSGSFLAPQLINVDPDTGQNSQGQKAVDTLVPKLEILRVILHRDGVPDKLDSELRATAARLLAVGKLTDRLLLLFESISKSLVTVDVVTGQIKLVLTTEALNEVLRIPTARPTLGPAIHISGGWLLINVASTEQTTGLLGVKANDDGTYTAELFADQQDLRNGLFQDVDVDGTPITIGTPTNVKVKWLVRFDPPVADGKDHILLVTENKTLNRMDHMVLRDRTADEAANDPTLGSKVPEFPGFPGPKPFLDFAEVSNVTRNSKVDLKDFPPTPIPGTSSFLLFDRALDTSSILTLTAVQQKAEDGTPFVASTVGVAASRQQFVDAIQEVNKGGEPFAGQFLFTAVFLHPDAARAKGDPKRKPLVLAYDGETKNLFTYNFETQKVAILTSSTLLSTRKDLNFDPDFDNGTFIPSPRFAADDVLNNKLAFDAEPGPDQIIAFNYDTGQVVVVLHKRDLTKVTGIGTIDVNYIETIDPPPSQGTGSKLRIVESDSSSVLAVNLEYLVFPVQSPTTQ